MRAKRPGRTHDIVQRHIPNAFLAYRLFVVGLGTLTLLTHVAFAQAGDGGIVVEMGGKILGFIFTLAGVAAAIGGAVVGVKMVVGSTVGSAFATANAILALIGVFGGLALAIAGPEIGAQIVEMTNGLSRDIVVPAGPGG